MHRCGGDGSGSLELWIPSPPVAAADLSQPATTVCADVGKKRIVGPRRGLSVLIVLLLGIIWSSEHLRALLSR